MPHQSPKQHLGENQWPLKSCAVVTMQRAISKTGRVKPLPFADVYFLDSCLYDLVWDKRKIMTTSMST